MTPEEQPFRGNTYRSPSELRVWHGAPREEALEPDLPIVDPHHHLWEDNARGRYLLNELVEDISGGHKIEATVFEECGAMYRSRGPRQMKPVGEIEFVAGVAAMSDSGNYGPTRACAGIVGTAELKLGDAVQEVLEAQIAAGGGRFRGVRDPVQYDAAIVNAPGQRRRPPGLLMDPQFRAGFARLAPLGLTFDAWLFQPQLPDLIDFAGSFPGTTIVLNHFGGPLGVGPYANRRSEMFDAWRHSIRELARRPNVVVKAGGLGMLYCGFDFHLRPTPPTSEEVASVWRPYVEATIEAFGAERCMFESNFPVDKQSCSYTALWNAFKRIAARYSKDEKAALFSGTAKRVYRLDLTSA
jgi:predicted TIM-barrel fold metal-dependent hydrolase